ncbi:MAG: hypothetical protein IIW73_02170 [Clostridia bacterium]|nr:hypothetical protein [Clostridia bacterium]
MNEVFAWFDAHVGLIGILLVIAIGACAVILAVDAKWRRDRDKKVKRLQYALETNERLIANKEKENWDLKVALFMAREDKKISERKLQEEINKRDLRITHLEQDKKQLTKWGK